MLLTTLRMFSAYSHLHVGLHYLLYSAVLYNQKYLPSYSSIPLLFDWFLSISVFLLLLLYASKLSFVVAQQVNVYANQV